VSFAPTGKRFDIIGAVDEVSPFPVANSSETTLCEADQRRPLAAEEIIWLRPMAGTKEIEDKSDMGVGGLSERPCLIK